MPKWLAVAVFLPLLAPMAAHAQMKGLLPPDAAGLARDRSLDLRLAQQQGFERPMPLVQGMIAHQDVTPNALVGIGLANLYGRKKRGDARIADPLVRSKKPAVTFVLKF